LARCLALDLGGVVLRINHTWADAAATAGVVLGSPQNGGGLNDFAPIHAFQKEAISYGEYTDELGRFLGVTPDEARRVHEGILIGPYDGADALIEDCRAAGLVLGVLSNTNRPHIEHCLATFPVCSMFDLFGTSYDARANKPEPEIFRWFESQLGVEASDVVFFDDGLVNVEAARSVGWTAHHVDPHDDPPAFIRSVLVDAGWLS